MMRNPFVQILLMFLIIFFLGMSSVGFAAEKAPADDFWTSYEKDTGAAETASSGVPQPGGAGDWLRMFASLIFVIGLILLAAYLFRRFAPRTISQGRTEAIRIVGTKMLGGRKSLMLVRVRGQTLLLGITPQSIQCLTEIQDLEGEWAQPSDGSNRPDSAAFDQQLERMIDPAQTSTTQLERL